jgi:type IV pilus assembly protein PilN
MRISVNLASRPFVELRPLYARLRIAAIALAGLAVVLGLIWHALAAKQQAAEAQMNALRSRTQQFQQERQRNESRMRQPQNMAVLERSQFLNDLFAKKSFSWTAVMMDLERVLPAGVQVASIEPATSKTGEVTIRLRVIGDRERAVDLVRNLERSQRFVAPRLAGEAAQTQDSHGGQVNPAANGPVGVEFEIYSGYNPLSAPLPKTSRAAKNDESAKPAQPKATSPRLSHPYASRQKGAPR